MEGEGLKNSTFFFFLRTAFIQGNQIWCQKRVLTLENLYITDLYFTIRIYIQNANEILSRKVPLAPSLRQFGD